MGLFKHIVFANENRQIRPLLVFFAVGFVFVLFSAAILQIFFMIAHTSGLRAPEWALDAFVRLKALAGRIKP